jgi:hypothetical protein
MGTCGARFLYVPSHRDLELLWNLVQFGGIRDFFLHIRDTTRKCSTVSTHSTWCLHIPYYGQFGVLWNPVRFVGGLCIFESVHWALGYVFFFPVRLRLQWKTYRITSPANGRRIQTLSRHVYVVFISNFSGQLLWLQGMRMCS